jgi:beta-glucanase (GH16 family)
VPAKAYGLSLAWNDEFDGPARSTPDPQKWGYDVGAGGWGNGELEDYTNSPDNAGLTGNGFLRIVARTADPAQAEGARYTSARLVTRNRFSFTYGVVSARVKVPLGQGLLPAFWLLGDDISQVGWPRSGEVDVMETRNAATVINSSLHGPVRGSSTRSWHLGGTLKASRPYSSAFHVYSARLQPGRVTMTVDGKQVFSLSKSTLPAGHDWVFDHAFYLLLDLAVGGNWPGPPDTWTQFPSEMLVDWVRVYE